MSSPSVPRRHPTTERRPAGRAEIPAFEKRGQNGGGKPVPSPGTILENVGRALPRHFRNERRLLESRVRENRGHMWNSGPTSEGAEAASEEPGARRERPGRPPPGSLGGSGHRDQQHRPERSAGAPREGPASSREAARNGRDERNKTFLHYWDTARVRGSRTHRPRSFPKGFAPEPATSTEAPTLFEKPGQARCGWATFGRRQRAGLPRTGSAPTLASSPRPSPAQQPKGQTPATHACCFPRASTCRALPPLARLFCPSPSCTAATLRPASFSQPGSAHTCPSAL